MSQTVLNEVIELLVQSATDMYDVAQKLDTASDLLTNINHMNEQMGAEGDEAMALLEAETAVSRLSTAIFGAKSVASDTAEKLGTLGG